MINSLSKDVLQHIVNVGKFDPREVSFFRASFKKAHSSVEDIAEQYRGKQLF